MRSETAVVVGSGSMATCFSARSQRNCSEMPVSAISSGSGGPMLSISARVRMAVCDMVFLFIEVGPIGPIGLISQRCFGLVQKQREQLQNPSPGPRAGTDQPGVAERGSSSDRFAGPLRSNGLRRLHDQNAPASSQCSNCRLTDPLRVKKLCKLHRSCGDGSTPGRGY